MIKNWSLRLATTADIPGIAEWIPHSVRTLQAGFYTPEQMEGALGSVFDVDRQLIVDGTYFIADGHGRIAGCGGWRKRQVLFGSDRDRIGENPLLGPQKSGLSSFIRIGPAAESEPPFSPPANQASAKPAFSGPKWEQPLLAFRFTRLVDTPEPSKLKSRFPADFLCRLFEWERFLNDESRLFES